MKSRHLLPLLLTLGLLAACARPAEIAPVPTAPLPSGAVSSAEFGQLELTIVPVATVFRRPTSINYPNDSTGRLFITEQAGTVRIITAERDIQVEPFLDLRDRVGSEGNEQGLLGLAFHPNYLQNLRFFVNYTDRDGDTVIAEFSARPDDPTRADAGSERVLLRIEQPASNHNGGQLAFGPDGYLYIATGDGGRSGDPWGNAQNPESLLGKLLRIDVNGSAPYAIPADNPFAEGGGAPEIWALGLRNPWRFSFDRATGDLFIADVGQNRHEEINFQPQDAAGGANYGWDVLEARTCFEPADCDPSGFIAPVASYAHDDQFGGCSVTGGYTYRGAELPDLQGVYLYSDYCTGHLWGLRPLGGAWQAERITTLDLNPTSFGEDAAGELYIADGEAGVIYQLVATGE